MSEGIRTVGIATTNGAVLLADGITSILETSTTLRTSTSLETGGGSGLPGGAKTILTMTADNGQRFLTLLDPGSRTLAEA